MVATDLITGWWRTDRMFCIAVAFLALVFAATTISGVIMLLQRRSLGRYLIVAGAVVAVLTYGGVFIAGARVAWIVHAFPLLPIASVVLALLPADQTMAAGVTDGLELADRGVVVHQLDPPGTAEVDQRHRRFADARHFLDPAQPVLVVGHPIAGRPAPAADAYSLRSGSARHAVSRNARHRSPAR